MKHERKRTSFVIRAILTVTALLLVAVMPAFASGHQVRVCHATGSDNYSNPNVPKWQIEDEDGHGSFESGVHPDDIVPPFDAGDHGQNSWDAYPGKNWDAAGIAIWENSCNVPDEEEPAEEEPAEEEEGGGGGGGGGSSSSSEEEEEAVVLAEVQEAEVLAETLATTGPSEFLMVAMLAGGILALAGGSVMVRRFRPHQR